MLFLEDIFLSSRRLRVLGVFALGVFLTACGAEDEADITADPGCISDAEYFQKQVSIPVLEKRCIACHTATGLARHSKLVLASPSESNYLSRNLEAVREVALYEYEGDSILLLKPANEIAHGGGEQLQRGTADFDALAGLVERFKNPQSCQSISADAAIMERVQLRDLGQTLRHAKMQLVGELPAAEEIAAVQEGGEAAFTSAIDGYLKRDAFYDVLRLWMNEKLHTNKYLRGDNATNLLEEDDYPERKFYKDLPDSPWAEFAYEHTNDSVAREPLDLVAYVVKNNRPFTEILTADYMVVNPYSARVYGLGDVGFDNEADPQELREGRIVGIPHAGILTSAMFLNRFPTTATNLNRHRGRMVLDLFLATDILKSGERPLDPTQVQDHNPTMNNPTCAKCHAEVDPIAGAFQNWDDRGRYRPPETGWPESLRPPGFGKDAIGSEDKLSSLQWLAKRITQDERFALAAVKIVYQGLVGRAPVENPTDETDPRYAAKLAFFNIEKDFLQTVAEKLMANEHRLKTIVADIILSPFYRAVAGEGLTPEEEDAIAPLGTAQLLTPERLDDRIVAVLGYPWKRRVKDRNQLTHRDQFLFFYGGIDSDQITRRITEPNGMMANIQMRMAAEMGCLLAPRDFAKEPSERLLLPFVEPSYEPTDINGFEVPAAVEAIRVNIQYLHKRILGEHLALSSPEIEHTFQLFMDTWREGLGAIDNDELSHDLTWHCRHNRDFWTDAELPDEERVVHDDNYTIRAWSAVLTYLIADWRFLYE